MNGNLWLVGYGGGQYWAMPNPVNGTVHNWTLVQAQNGTMVEGGLRVSQNQLTFIKTAVQQQPNGVQPKASAIGL